VVDGFDTTLQRALIILPLGLFLAMILSFFLKESYNKEQEHCL
jgi:ABC-type phosphate/phosphonate transport system permease subunit